MLKTKLLDDSGVLHGFTTKEDGSFKTSKLTSTPIEMTALNVEKFQTTYLAGQKTALLYLVGGSKVSTIGPTDGSLTVLDCDGAVTTEKIVLALSVADCVPVLLSDKEAGVIGVAHGGWQGLFGGVVEKVVKKMIESGAKAEKILASIGPSICVNCYEVGEEVASKFPKEVINRNFEKTCLDLKQETIRQLRNVDVENYQVIDICTYENTDSLFSARASGQTGRFLGFISNR